MICKYVCFEDLNWTQMSRDFRTENMFLLFPPNHVSTQLYNSLQKIKDRTFPQLCVEIIIIINSLV